MKELPFVTLEGTLSRTQALQLGASMSTLILITRENWGYAQFDNWSKYACPICDRVMDGRTGCRHLIDHIDAYFAKPTQLYNSTGPIDDDVSVPQPTQV